MVKTVLVEICEKTCEDLPKQDLRIELISKDSTKKSASQICHLQNLSTTRWAARTVMYALKQSFAAIIHFTSVFVDSNHDSNEMAKASTINTKINWTFILTLLRWNKVLDVVGLLNRLLQSKAIDLCTVCYNFAKTTKKLADGRSEEYFNDFVKEAKNLWTAYGFSAENASFRAQHICHVKLMLGKEVL